MSWIGRLKAANYEAESIVLFVANSPLMKFFYRYSKQYRQHLNKESEVVPANIIWHKSNGTYIFAYCLGTVIIIIGLLTLAGIWSPEVGIDMLEVKIGNRTKLSSLAPLTFRVTKI